MNTQPGQAGVEFAEDVCVLSLARRLAALLDRDPAQLREGQALPRGWHVMLFNVPTLQSQLRADGAAHLGVTLPDIGLPRLMLGGRQVRFNGDIPLGAQVRRETRQGEVQLKNGRSGRFALVKVEHSIFVQGADEAVVIETNDYVLREASSTPAPASTPLAAAPAPAAAAPAVAAPTPLPDAVRTITPDERTLFRYSAITDNPHRIHYDLAYATGVEGYPALVVNGSIPAMFLLELFRAKAGREPQSFTSRNLSPMFCGHPLTLCAVADRDAWRLWAQDQRGTTTFDARAT